MADVPAAPSCAVGGKVAEIMVRPGDGAPVRRGSGYLVTSHAVLTAAHVVVGNSVSVTVRFDADQPGERVSIGQVAWMDSSTDVAVIILSDRAPSDGTPSPGFGMLPDYAAVLRCSAVGFPRFKLKERDNGLQSEKEEAATARSYRDSHQAEGTIAVLSNRREHTLEMTVTPPAYVPDGADSPWAGMSGAAVWCAGRIVGVVSKHRATDGPGRLTVARLDRCLATPRQAELASLLGLPNGISSLEGVTPPPLARVAEGYRASARDIAPEILVGREAEIARLVRFCASDELYCWIEGEAWAGKTALASWFVLHPPDGVDVVSFFVTATLASQQDSEAFSWAMIEQLAAIAGEDVPTGAVAGPGVQDRMRRRLIDAAADASQRRGRRLLIVVDGLDEDQGVRPHAGLASIASQLPRVPRPGLGVLITSRPHPPLPDDVADTHPLYACTRQLLEPSPHALGIRRRARRELLHHLHSGAEHAEIIGFITAAEGGLTLAELAELTGRARYELEPMIDGALGRSLRAHSIVGTDDRIYAFGHDALRALAEEQLTGAALAQYVSAVHQWGERYQLAGWPAYTPRYLLVPYGRLLASHGDIGRLAIYATDSRRADLLLTRTYSNAAAISEIAATQEIARNQPEPDLGLLVTLALRLDALIDRSNAVPVSLPAVWAALGDLSRAEALATGRPGHRYLALSEIVTALTRAGQVADARRFAAMIRDPRNRSRVVATIPSLLMEAGRRDDARLAIDEIPDGTERYRLTGELAVACATVGDWRSARDLTSSLPRPWQTSQLVSLTLIAAKADPGTAPLDELIDDLNTLPRQVNSGAADHDRVAALARLLAEMGRTADAERILSRTSGRDFGTALTTLVIALAHGGRWTEAIHAAGAAAEPHDRVKALCSLLTTVPPADMRIGSQIADLAEDAVLAVTDKTRRKAARWEVAIAAVGAAIDTAFRISAACEQQDGDDWADKRSQQAVRILGQAAASADSDRIIILADAAESVSFDIADAVPRMNAVVTLAGILAKADPSRAARLAVGVAAQNLEQPQLTVSAALIRLLAELGEPDMALRLTSLPGCPRLGPDALSQVYAAAGRWREAEELVMEITMPYLRDGGLAQLSASSARAGRLAEAERLAWMISQSRRDGALIGLCAQLTESGQDGDAERLVLGMSAGESRDKARAALAAASGRAGRLTDARRHVGAIEDDHCRVEAMITLAGVLVEADDHGVTAMARDAEIGIAELCGLEWIVRESARLIVIISAYDREVALRVARHAMPSALSMCEAKNPGRAMELAVALAGVDPEASVTLIEATQRCIAEMGASGSYWLGRLEHLIVEAFVKAGRPHDAERIAATLGEQAAVSLLRLLPGMSAARAIELAGQTTPRDEESATHQWKFTIAVCQALIAGDAGSSPARIAGDRERLAAMSQLLRLRGHVRRDVAAQLSRGVRDIGQQFCADHNWDAAFTRLVRSLEQAETASRTAEDSGKDTVYSPVSWSLADEVAAVLATTDCWTGLEQLIPSSSQDLRDVLIRKLIDARDWSRAVKMSKQGRPADHVCQALICGLAEAGMLAEAVEVSEEAERAAQDDKPTLIREIYHVPPGISTLFDALLGAHRWAEAEQVAPRLKDPIAAFGRLGSALASVGRPDDAERIAGLLRDRYRAPNALASVALALALAQDHRIARNLAEDIERIAQPTAGGKPRHLLHPLMALALADVDPDRALQFLMRLDMDEARKNTNLTAFLGLREKDDSRAQRRVPVLAAAQYARTGQYAKSIEVIGQLADRSTRAAAAACVSREIATDASEIARLADLALLPAVEIADPSQRLTAIGQIISVAVLHKADGLLIEQLADVAVGHAADLTDDDSRIAAVAHIIRKSGSLLSKEAAIRMSEQAGTHASAATITPSPPALERRAGALMNMAQALSSAHPDMSASLLKRCEELVASSTEHKLGGQTVSCLSWMHASLGQWEHAENLATAIKDPLWRTETFLAMTAIALKLAPSRALRYAVSAERMVQNVADRSKRQDLLDRLAGVAVEVDVTMARRVASDAQGIAFDLTDTDWGPTLNIAFALAATGHLQEAREELESITDDASPQASVEMQVERLLYAGRLDDAESLRQALGGITAENMALAYFRAHRWADAERVVQEAQARSPLALAVAETARMLQAGTGPERDEPRLAARHAVAQCLTEAQWPGALELVALIDPAVVIGAANEVLR